MTWVSSGAAGRIYLAACALLVAGGIWFRLSVPLSPLVDGDSWGYLWPALNGVEHGVFSHANGRAFPYPLFLRSVLALFGDIRAVTLAQYALGIATALLALDAWHRAARLIDPSGHLWPLQRLLGVAMLFICLFYLGGVNFERSILPETLYACATTGSAAALVRAVEACARRPDRKALALGIAFGCALAVLAIKPHGLLAAAVVGIAVVVLGAVAHIGVRGLALAVIVPLGLFATLFVLPERRLAAVYDRETSQLFLPGTMFCWHLAAILPELRREADAAETPEARRALIREVDAVLQRESLAAAGHYTTLGYDADRCLYGSMTAVVSRHLAGNVDRRSAFFWEAFRRGVAADPGAYALKVYRELRDAYREPMPYDLGMATLQTTLAIARQVAGQSPLFDRAMALHDPATEPRRRKLQRLTSNIFYPLAAQINAYYATIVGLAVVCAVAVGLAALGGLRGRVAAASGWGAVVVLGLAGLQLGTNLTIALSHSHAVARYRIAQYPLTVLAAAAAVLLLSTLALQLWLYLTRNRPRGLPAPPGAGGHDQGPADLDAR